MTALTRSGVVSPSRLLKPIRCAGWGTDSIVPHRLKDKNFTR